MQWSLWRWVAAFVAAEVIGLGGAGVVGLSGALLAGDDPSTLVVIASATAMLAAGAFEGACVGFAQWMRLRTVLPGFSRRPWIVATAIGALGAWFLGGLSSTVVEFETISDAVLIPAAGVGGILAGAILGGAQWVVLRRYVPNAGVWVWANVLGWSVGLAVSFLGVSLTPAEFSPLALLTIGLTAAATGLTPALATGIVVPQLAGSEVHQVKFV
jgi:hypothetical protein